jgi:hypothetical protein
MSPMRGIARAMLGSALCGVCAVETAATAEGAVQDALAQCETITGRDDRLACYDALALQQHRAPADSGPAPVHQSAAAPAAVPAAAASTAAAAESERPEDFGLSAQHGLPARRVSSITARVSGFSHSKQGKIQVELDNGQAWELEEADPLLAPGDPVTIRRGTLSSYLLNTPSKRSHRVRRTR